MKINQATTYIIAEAGVNHNGSVAIAKQLIDAAVDGGADAVKFQAFQPKELVAAHVQKAAYQSIQTGEKGTQLEMLEKLELDEGGHQQLYVYAQERGIEFLSAPFDLPSLKMLQSLPIRRIKIPSGEISNGPLLFRAGQSGMPIILSTGMSTLADIASALDLLSFAASRQGAPKSRDCFEGYRHTVDAANWLSQRLTLLQCTSAYPTPLAEVNLRAIVGLADCFGVSVGLSDHSLGITVPIAAAALGASVIEKHLTLDRTMSGPDHAASLEPEEFKEMVTRIREVELSLGKGAKEPTSSEMPNRELARKYLVARERLKQGVILSEGNLTTKRSSGGISAMYYWDLVGQAVPRDYDIDEALRVEDFILKSS